MNAFVRTGVAATLMLMVSTVMAQTTQEHSKHHPAGETPAAKSASPATAPTSTTNRLATMDKHMAEMKVVREKLATAKTPQERQALMAEHMKVMRAGMDMMSMGSGQTGNSAQVPQGTQGGMMGDMAQRHQLMEKRLEMMENMMRMMMDRVQ